MDGAGVNWGRRAANRFHGDPPEPRFGVLFSLMRSWAAGLVVTLGAGYLLGVLALDALATPERLESFGWRMALLHVPGAVVITLAGLAAARLHKEPYRHSLPLHLLAALAVPAAVTLRNLFGSWDIVVAEGVWTAAASLVFGAVCALLLDRLWEGRGEGRSRHPWDDLGQTAVDYIGMLVVVVAVIAGLLATGAGRSIGGQIKEKLCRAFGGSCGGDGQSQADGKKDADFEPPLCNITTVSDTAGSEAKIAWFKWGNEYGFQQQVFQAKTDVNGDGKVDGKDQKVYLTFTDAASVGAAGEWKPGLKVGKLGTDKVELGAGVKVTNGDTWAFDSPEQAEKFRKDIEVMKTWETTTKYGGMGGGNPYAAYKYAKEREKIEKKLGDRHIGYGKIGLEGTAEAGLKISAADEKKLSAQLGGKFKFSPEVTFTNNDINGTKAYTYSAGMEYGGKTGVEAGGLSGSSEGTVARTGTMTVTRDKKTGKLTRIDMTQTIDRKGNDGGKASGSKDNGKDGDDKKGGGAKAGGSSKTSDVDLVTNSIVFAEGDKGDADRATAEKWLDGSGDNTAPFTYMFGDHAPTSRPGDDDRFGQLLFDKGMSSKMHYTGESSAAEYGFDLTLGLSLGFKVSTEHSDQKLDEAKFLGAPADGKRGYVPYSYCAK
ncbi:hypothetical protein [Streptomyces roseifaciens]|uniref:hypothetical protein n=1 Tax=Streptomyces roseifaciens TaxID=1488406 RepID=UPI000A760BC8|nr:hypothetical protein [Streptomyces roseifaciens]